MGMELPLAAIRRQIASGIDLVVHLGRLRDRSRRVLEITEILDHGTDEIGQNVLYRFRETGEDADGRIIGNLEKTGELIATDKLRAAGICHT